MSIDSDLLDDRQSLYANASKKEAEILENNKRTFSIEHETKLISSLFVTVKRTPEEIRAEKDTYQIGYRRRKRRQPKKKKNYD